MVFQIAFVLLNLSIPLWFWVNSKSTDRDKIQWNTLNQNLERLIVNNGGFPPCSSRDLADKLQKLCERSQEKLRDGADTTVDKIGEDIIFTCKVGVKSISVKWTAQKTAEGSLDCNGTKGSSMIYQNPGFEFGYSGRLGRITFTSATGERQTERVSNCRVKLKALRKIVPPPMTADGVVEAMPAVEGDANDQLSANRLCLTYDIAPDWKTFRR